MNRKVSKAIFPVAGLGTRFLPATKSVPKEIMTLVDRPLIQYAIDEARAAGIEDFIFVTSRGKSALEDYFDFAPDLEASLEAKGKTELLNILHSTNMESGTVQSAAATGLALTDGDRRVRRSHLSRETSHGPLLPLAPAAGTSKYAGRSIL